MLHCNRSADDCPYSFNHKANVGKATMQQNFLMCLIFSIVFKTPQSDVFVKQILDDGKTSGKFSFFSPSIIYMKNSEIRFKITLDERNLPQSIKWQASDSQHNELKDCKTMMVSIWDAVEKTNYNMHLWTTDMTTDEMHSHFFQTLLTYADSYHRATGNPHVKEAMKKFTNELAGKTADWEIAKQNP